MKIDDRVVKAWVDYQGSGTLHYWRTTSGFEVDFILNESIAIEIKATRNAGGQDVRGLRALMEEVKLRRAIVVSLDPRPRRMDRIEILPYRAFLTALWSGEFG